MDSQRLAIPDLGRVYRGESVSGLSEWQLLERYREGREEAAFEALVLRHGPMVLGVCRRMLGGSPEAEDAFQATFLILVRRARDLGPRDAIGPWLYGVALRVAARARTRASRDRRVQGTPLEQPVPDRGGPSVDPDLAEVLDQELGRLPASYRAPLVLCYLEGRTHEEAARDLGWPLGTVKGRLARARDRLRSRLAHRGLAPSAAILDAVSSPDLALILDRPLIERTVASAGRLASGQAVAQAVSGSITSLVEGVLGTMFHRKLAPAVLAALATGFALTTAAVLGQAPSKKSEPPAKAGEARPPGKPPMKFVVVPQGTDSARANDPRSLAILAKLEEPVSMSFANETPLDDVLKYIKQATTTPTYSGLPIYIDPIGLQDAQRSVNSTIQIDLEGVPLRRTLQILLAQLDLVYFVEDGMLVITSKQRAANYLPPPMAGPAPIHQMVARAERGELDAREMKELVEVLRLRREVEQLRQAERIQGDRFGATPAAAKAEADEMKALLGEIRTLIQLLKADLRTRQEAELRAKQPPEPKKAG